MEWLSKEIEGLIRRASDEDIGAGDATCLAMIPPSSEGVGSHHRTGADFLSSGALTHSAPAADLSLLVESIEET